MSPTARWLAKYSGIAFRRRDETSEIIFHRDRYVTTQINGNSTTTTTTTTTSTTTTNHNNRNN